MYFVNYVNLIAQDIGGIVDPFLQIVHVIDAPVAGFIYFYDIEGISFIDGAAGITLIAWLTVDWIAAIDCFGKDTRGTGLTAAARAAKKISVGYSAAFNCVAKSLDNMFLTCYL